MSSTSNIQRWRAGANEHRGKLFVLQAIGFVLLGVVIARTLWPTSSATSPEQSSAATAAAVDTIWTCSMHPQIRQPKPGKCPICGMELIPVANAVGAQAASLRQMALSPDAVALMRLETAPVERRYVTAEIRMVGKVDYDETRLGYITAWVPGRLDRMFVDYTGVEIAKGDHVAEVYSPELYAAQQELILAAQSARDGSQRTSTIGGTLLESAREKLRLWGMTPEQIESVERQGRPTDHMTIHAPVGGVVIHKNRQEGDYVAVGERIYTIADLAHVWVMLEAYESDLPWLHYGQPVSFTTEAYPGDVFTGRIVFIDPVLNPKTRTVKVRVNVDNAGLKLKPEMFVRAVVRAQIATAGRVLDPELAGKWISPMHPEIVKDEPGVCDICGMELVSAESLGYVTADTAAVSKPLVIPVSAALITGTRAIVYVQTKGGDQPTYEGRQVVLGPRAGDYYIVRNGLEEGEQVVVNGAFKIDSALQIQAKPSAMTPSGGGGGGHQHYHGDASEKSPAQGAQVTARLPAAFLEQFDSIEAAFGAVSDAVQSADLRRMQASFLAFQNSLREVSAEGLSGHPAMAWKELEMLLSNDAIEGSQAVRPEDAYRVFVEMNGHLERLRQLLPASAAHAHSSNPVREKFATPVAVDGQLSTLWAAYQQLVESLVNDDVRAAQAAIHAIGQAQKAVDSNAMTGEARSSWNGAAQRLSTSVAALTAADDLASIRIALGPLSSTMVDVANQFGFGADATVYLLHCPMAFDNRGAVWLQPDQHVRNPYFGAKMLSCADEVRPLNVGQVDAEEDGHAHE